MNVPFVDLVPSVRPLRAAFLKSVQEILDSGHFVGGKSVEEFESSFAGLCNTKHAVSVATGTDAIVLMLRGLDIGPGDEVITVTNSFVATAESIAHAGARPVLVDAEAKTLNIDPLQVESRMTGKTRAIVAVHLFGQCAAMERLSEIANGASIHLFEDAAQAHGATRNGQPAGSLGTAAAFSFYPTKNLGTCGEGGAVTTDSDDLAERVLALRDHGQTSKHEHAVVGYNSRLDAIKCAYLRLGLERLEENNASRQRIAAHYRERLTGVDGLSLLDTDPSNVHVHHVFPVRVRDRDRVRRALNDKEIGTAVHYPMPIHLQPAFESLGYARGDFPVAEAAMDELLSLPMYPGLSESAVDYVSETVRGALR